MVGSNILAALVRVSATYRNKIKFQDLITLYAYSFDNSTVSVPCLIVRSFVPSSIQYFLTTPVTTVKIVVGLGGGGGGNYKVHF